MQILYGVLNINYLRILCNEFASIFVIYNNLKKVYSTFFMNESINQHKHLCGNTVYKENIL